MNKGFIIDMEGTLINSGKPIPGAIDFINYLNKNCIQYYIVTNTVSKTIEQYEEILMHIGIEIVKEKIVNPIIVLNTYLRENGINKYFFVGPDKTKKLLPETLKYDIPDYIIFCDFENIELNYDYMNNIFQYIKRGAKIITTSYSDFYVSKNEFKMDTGIFVKMYEALTDKKAINVGKPSEIIYKTAINKFIELDRNNICVIGDDGFSDIMGAKEIGMETIMVKTGIYRNGDEKKYKPNKIIENLSEIIKEI